MTFRLVVLLASALLSPSTPAATYHVAEGGDDANDGLSPARAIRTVARVNALDLRPGDRVLFRRGDLFRGSVEGRSGVTYGAFGDGDALPTICGSRRDYADPGLWERTGEPNVWRCTERIRNAGIVLFDREPRRIDGEPRVAEMRLPRRSEPFDSPVALDADLTFRNLFREGRLELRSDGGNPGERFRHIEIGEHGHCVWINADDLLVEDLHLTLTGSHGVGGSGTRRNVTVRNCRIDWLGGSVIEGWKFGTARFGNAIEIWGGCDGFRALGNRIANVYDTGVTVQCNDRADFVCRIENVLFASNVIDSCFWALEYYNRNNAPGSLTRNVRFEGNLCRGTGRGWGCRGRESRAPAVSIGETPEGSSGIVVAGNRLMGSTGPLVLLREPVAKGAVSFRGNVYAQRPGGVLLARQPALATFATTAEARPLATFPCDASAQETIRRELGDDAAQVVALPETAAAATDADSFDVAVIGGGPAGLGAALAAARTGARTVLVEREARLGGTTVSAEVLWMGLFHAWDRQVIAGPCWDLVTNAVDLAGGTLPRFAGMDPRQWWKYTVTVNPFVYSALAAETLERAGVTLKMNAAACGLARTPDGWRVTLASEAGLDGLCARVVVDATGNGTVAASAGAARVRSDEAHRQPGSYFFRLNTGGKAFDAEALDRAHAAAVASGELLPTDVHIRLSDYVRNGGGWGCYVPQADNSTAAARADTNRRGREVMLRVLRFLRRQPGLEGATVVAAAPEVGVRETYRVVGEKTVTGAAYLSGTAEPDALCFSYWFVDVHNAASGDSRKAFHEPGKVGTVPLGALIPKGVPNLLVAGRAVSSDQDANSALRVQASCMAMGQAAGAVAACAAARGVDPRAVDLAEAKSALRAMGALVP